MKKIMVLLIVLLGICSPMVVFSQTIQVDTTIVHEDADQGDTVDGDSSIPKCYSAVWNLGTSQNYINQKCPPNAFSVLLTIKDGFPCWISNIGDYPKATLYFGSIVVDEVNAINEGQSYLLSGEYAGLNLDEYVAPMEIEIRIEVEDYLGFTNFSDTRTITLLPEGGEFTIEEFSTFVTIADVCDPVQAEVVVCHDDAVSQEITIKKTTTTLNQTSVNAGLEIKVEGQVAKAITINANLGANQTYTLSNTATINTQINLPLNIPEDETCVYPGILVKARKYKLNTYKLSCDGNQLISSAPGKTEIMSVNPKICSGPWENECVNPDGELDPQPDGGGLRVTNTENCTGSIFAYVTQDLPPGSIFLFYWQGPDGFVSFEQHLIDVPYGHYTLNIYDGCGNVYIYETYLCDNTVYGNWNYDDISTGPFCRDINCGAPGEDCNISMGTECVYPEFTDWEFEYLNAQTQRCIRQVILNGQPTNLYDEKPPEYTDDYDAHDDRCYRYFMCLDENGSIDDDYTHEASPTEYGDWDYDGDVCFREVICFGQANQDFDEQEVEPEINWFEYDEGFEECIGYVFCDDDDNTNNDNDADAINDEGYADIEWDLSYNNSTCVGTVFCGDEYQELPEEIEHDSEIVEVEYDEGDNWCEVIYACGDDEFSDILSIDTEYAYEKNGVIYCYILCAGEEATDDPIPCPGLTSPDDDDVYKSVQNGKGDNIAVFPNPFRNEITIANLSETSNTIELFSGNGIQLKSIIHDGTPSSTLSMDDLQAGIYFLLVYDAQNKILLREKVIKLP